MQIVKNRRGAALELVLQGRLDAYWADHLDAAIAEVVREGHRHLALNMANVEFLTSAGIRVLLKYYKQLSRIDGALAITQPAAIVAEVLRSMGLGKLIAESSPAEPPPAPSAETAAVEQVQTERALFEIRPDAPGALLTCEVFGDPALLRNPGQGELTVCPVRLPRATFAVGIGAPGNDLADSCTRFGDFLAVDGAVAFLPSGQAETPDYLLAQGDFVPQLQTLQCLRCTGGMAAAIGFEALPDATLPLLDLVEQCFAAVGSDAVGVVVAAESAGLVGATLRRSPATAAAGENPFQFPAVRDWMRFAPERVFMDDVVLLAGVACRRPPPRLAAALRPLGPGVAPHGHFHAVAFSYTPLRKRGLTLQETVQSLFEHESLRGLLHLLHDARPVIGVGQSEFLRGTCWTAPLQ